MVAIAASTISPRGNPELMTRAILLILVMLVAECARPDDYFEQQRVFRLEKCMSIPAHEYTTGMLFNPPGYKTYYKRALCLQRLAIDEHDPELCVGVRERKAFFFDGSAISSDSVPGQR